MPQDNTLGAPTEGLGQTVTFAGNSQGGVPQMQAGRRQALRNDPASGGAQLTAQALQVPEVKADPTFAVLMKLGGETIKPHLEAARTAAYVRGWQRAAQRQAVKEIADEQPWYSQLFGPTSLVDGARAYTASAKVASATADMEAKMPELRRMSEEEFGNYTAELITKNPTGDSTTDLMVSQQLASALPIMMKAQAKEHLRYQQELLEESKLASNAGHLANLHAVTTRAREPGAVTDFGDVLKAMRVASDNVFVRPPDMPKETHDKLVTQSLATAIAGGNMDAYGLAVESGYLDKLPANYQQHVQQAYSLARHKAVLNLPVGFLEKKARVLSMGHTGASREDITKAWSTLNEEYSQTTGDPNGFLSQEALVGGLQQSYDSELVRSRQAANDLAHIRDTEQKALQKIAVIQDNARKVVLGVDGQPFSMSSLKPAEQQEVFRELQASASPAVRVKVMADQFRVAIDDVHKEQMSTAIFAAKRSTSPLMFHDVYVNWYLPLKEAGGDNGAAVAQKYAGEHGEDMQRYDTWAQGRTDLNAAEQAAGYDQVINPPPKPLHAAKGSRDAALLAAVKTVHSPWYDAITPWSSTDLKNPEGFAALIKRHDRGDLPAEDAVKFAEATLPNLSVVGGYHFLRSTGATDIRTWVGANPVVGGANVRSNLDNAMELTVEKHARLSGIEGTPEVIQAPDSADKEPWFVVTGMGKDGHLKITSFPGGELHKTWASGEGRVDARDFKIGPIGPAPRALVEPDMPPLYGSSQEEWAAFRKRQAARKTNTK